MSRANDADDNGNSGQNYGRDGVHDNDGPYPCGSYEDCMEQDFEVRHYDYWYWGRGIFTTWMVIVSGLIYDWYPSRIYNDAWWRIQCPQTPYRVAADLLTTVTSSVGTLTATAPAVPLTEVAINGWSRQECL